MGVTSVTPVIVISTGLVSSFGTMVSVSVKVTDSGTSVMQVVLVIVTGVSVQEGVYVTS